MANHIRGWSKWDRPVTWFLICTPQQLDERVYVSYPHRSEMGEFYTEPWNSNDHFRRYEILKEVF